MAQAIVDFASLRAGAIVDFALGKLCDAAFQHIVSLYQFDDKMGSVKRELTRIQCFLEDAERKVGRDARVRNWVEELKSVSVMIAGAIDTFVKEVELWTRNDPGVMQQIERAIKFPMQLIAKCKLGKKIDRILATLDEIDKARERYGIQNLGDDRIIESAVRVGPNRYIIPDLDDLEVVGFVADKEKITTQLLDESITRRSVVSIVGTGGLGKTTLAHKVYASDAVKSKFEVRIWLSISQEFKLVDLLKKMLQQLRSIEKQEEDRAEEYFLAELNKSLRKKKYLIVMDDVWSEDLWPQISVALPDVKNGSRVLMTSRFANITKEADCTYEPFLNTEESRQLLLKIALPNQDCPNYLLDIAKCFVDKCGHLPLALVVLGALLSKKQKLRYVWENMLKTMVWSVHGVECMNILSTSYDHMPPPLKYCFMYLACFPEDFEINARNLIRLWVAEELIPQQPGSTLEDIAEEYLEQLAERYMVIVVRRRYDESIKTVRVHDVLRNLAIDKAKEDNFITVLSNKDVNGSQSIVSCRVALQSSCVDQLEEDAYRNLHSLHYYSYSIKLLDFSGYEMLKVCNIEAPDHKQGTIRLERSNQLRFCRVSRLHLHLNLNVGELKNIQTLDLRHLLIWETDLQLPDAIWGIETLRHVLFPRFYPIRGPPSGAMLRNLQTLGYVTELDSWGTHLPYITNVRCLKLEVVNSTKIIASLLQTLHNLISLTLYESDIFLLKEEEYTKTLDNSANLLNMQTFPFYKSLRKLCISGYLGVDSSDLPTIMLPLNLIKLQLECTWLRKDPMPALEKHQSLKILILGMAAYEGKKMICLAGGFRCLEQLQLSCLHDLEELVIEGGAMPSLKQLKIEDCWSLEQLEIQEGAMPILELFKVYNCKTLKLLPSLHWTSCRIEHKNTD